MDDLNAWRGRRVLVTGGSGFVGRHVLSFGLGREARVYNLSSHDPGIPGVQSLVCDLRDHAALRQLIASLRPEAIIHLASAGVISGPTPSAELLAVNAIGLDVLLDSAASLPEPPVVVVAGSGFEYAPQDRPIREDDPLQPNSAYGLSKAAAALVASYYASRLPITLIRYFNLYGIGDVEPRLAPYIIRCARDRIPVELTACEQIRDFIEVGEAAEGTWRVLARPPEAGAGLRVLNLGTGRPLTLRHFVETLADLLAQQGTKPDLRIGAKAYRQGEPNTVYADNTALRNSIDWVPTMTIEDGLRRMVEVSR